VDVAQVWGDFGSDNQYLADDLFNQTTRPTDVLFIIKVNRCLAEMNLAVASQVEQSANDAGVISQWVNGQDTQSVTVEYTDARVGCAKINAYTHESAPGCVWMQICECIDEG
jgi:hypothetical protein